MVRHRCGRLSRDGVLEPVEAVFHRGTSGETSLSDGKLELVGAWERTRSASFP